MQLWILPVNEQLNYFKDTKLQLLIDKDLRFKSEKIRIQAIKSHQWYQLPSAKRLTELTEDYYGMMLCCARLLKLGHEGDAIYLQSQFVEPFLIHLVQWLTYCGESFSNEEMAHLQQVMRDVSIPVLSNQTKSKWEHFLNYLKTGEELLSHFATIMNYKLDHRNSIQLKDYISVLIKDVIKAGRCDKTLLIGLY